MARIIIVNESDEIIGYKERGTLKPEDIYRVSALSVDNSKGEVLLAQRKFTKKKDPGKWGPAVVGTNDEGETYESNIIKEAEEEIGLVDFDFKEKNKSRIKKGTSNFWGVRFESIIDKTLDEFRIQEEEVEKIRWFNKKELLNLVEESPEMFVPTIKDFV